MTWGDENMSGSQREQRQALQREWSARAGGAPGRLAGSGWRTGCGPAWMAAVALLAAMAPAQARQPAVAEAAYAFSLTGRVVSVADGDTMTLLVDKRRERIRLASIDAPEVTKDSKRPGQPMAQQSRKALADLVAGKTLTVRCYEKDRYQRNVCDVMLPDGSSANQHQVAAGLAWANMEKRGRFMRDDALPELERQARRARLSIWQRTDAVAPWVWRYQCWQLGECS